MNDRHFEKDDDPSPEIGAKTGINKVNLGSALNNSKRYVSQHNI